jgi:hypothetical protein
MQLVYRGIVYTTNISQLVARVVIREGEVIGKC